MRVVGEDDIRAVVTTAVARRAVHDAFCAMSDGQTIAPDELAMKLDHGGELHVKGAYLGGEIIAFKAATGQFPGGGNSGFTAVLDATTGAPVAILQDGGWLTEMRTAAASAVSAVALARSNSSRLAILGGGYQAAFQVAALRDAFDLKAVNSWSRSPETTDRFGLANNTTPCGSVGEAVKGADIIVCCTPSREPLLALDMVTPGAHIVAMGADMIGKRELATDITNGCHVLVADSVAVTRVVGELQHAPDQAGRAVDLGDILTGRATGRTDDLQITVADLCGLGIQDAAMAQLVMNSLRPLAARM